MRFVVSLIILMLVLTACGGDGGNASINTQVPVGPSTPDLENSLAATYAVTTQEVTSDDSVVVVTPQGQSDDFEVPLPGTLVLDTEYVDENQSLVFDKLAFIRYAGPEGSEVINFKLNRDGTYTLNDQPGQVSSDVVTRIDNLLDEVNFFAIASPMLGPNIESGNYRYRLTVTRGSQELTINAEDTFTPNDVLRIFSSIMGVIVESQSTLLPTPTLGEAPVATETSG